MKTSSVLLVIGGLLVGLLLSWQIALYTDRKTYDEKLDAFLTAHEHTPVGADDGLTEALPSRDAALAHFVWKRAPDPETASERCQAANFEIESLYGTAGVLPDLVWRSCANEKVVTHVVFRGGAVSTPQLKTNNSRGLDYRYAPETREIVISGPFSKATLDMGGTLIGIRELETL